MTTVIIETERTVLRPLEPADAPALGVAMRDSNITETTLFEPPARTRDESVERALARIAEFSEHWSRYGFGVFGAFDRSTGALVGYCGLRHLDEFDGDINISTMVDRPYWSEGLSSEIVRRNLEFAFLDLDLDKVHGASRIFDGASVHIMERCGFVREPDRMYGDWLMRYYTCRKEAFLAQHVIFLKQCLADMKRKSLSRSAGDLPAGNKLATRNIAVAAG